MSQTRNTPAKGPSAATSRILGQSAAHLPAMTERNLQSAVIKLAKFHGYEVTYHTHDSRRSQPGFPDLVLASTRRGRLLFRELKTDKGRMTADQRQVLDVLAAVGADAGVWRPADLVSGRIQAELSGDF
ncbi:VRR-NUC domain-containing protein [Zhihengliuella flava]|uniref:VRR-NUC domain-containing protein n=1 Tax=Zhihengliuella flava TaxID=1285193 RepID=A0A931DBH7_9MICC|nr:VRR-NUC domain-containing protein [Zhihengliuella flava]MBG6085839.1 hypothetical protein [Zhihengliuella flava]